jgi:hypothetical protein
MIQFEDQAMPTESGLYVINREKAGHFYRYYNAETKTWGFCSFDKSEAYEKRDTPSGVGFFGWRGPISLNEPVKREITVAEPVVAKLPLASKKSKTVAPKQQVVAPKQRTRTASKAPNLSKPTMANGTIFYRADRQKWVAVWDGKQEAARPTKEACIKFLDKKYSFKDVIIIE